MENFYDLNDFIAYMLRRWKVIIVILCISTLGFAGIRFSNLYSDYQKAKNQPVEIAQVNKTSEPMKAWVEININVGPNYEIIGSTGISRGEEIAMAYNSVRNDDGIMGKMYEQYFEQAKIYGDEMRNLMSQYGYILDKEKGNEYKEYDFRRQFAVSINKNFVTIGFYSLNEDFSREVAESYEKLLTDEVEKQYPDFEYEKVSESTRYELPDTSAGASPSRSVSGGGSASVVTMSTVIKQTIKGCVWGAMLGVVIALIVTFFMYMMSRKIIIWAQLKKANVRVFGLCYRKNTHSIGKQYRKWIAALEGNKTAFADEKQLAEVILSDLNLRIDKDEKVMVCGNGDIESVKKVAIMLNAQEQQERFVLADSPLTSARGIKMAGEFSKVLLVERIGKSLKVDLDKEIETFNNYKVEIMGIVGVE